MEKILEIINPEFLVPALIGFIVIDIVLGVFKALKNGTFEAKKMASGLLGTQIYVAVPMIIALIFDKLIVASNGWFLNATAIFYIVYELGSIVENLGEAKFPFPKWIKGMFELLKKADIDIIPDEEDVLPEPEVKKSEG